MLRCGAGCSANRLNVIETQLGRRQLGERGHDRIEPLLIPHPGDVDVDRKAKCGAGANNIDRRLRPLESCVVSIKAHGEAGEPHGQKRPQPGGGQLRRAAPEPIGGEGGTHTEPSGLSHQLQHQLLAQHRLTAGELNGLDTRSRRLPNNLQEFLLAGLARSHVWTGFHAAVITGEVAAAGHHQRQIATHIGINRKGSRMGS